MKTFTATELNKEPAKIYREADRHGSVLINNDRYPHRIFELSARDRGVDSPFERIPPIDKEGE